MNKKLLRSASILLAIALTLGRFSSGRATSQSATLMPNRTINLAFFYRPPSNSDAATIANNFSNVILTGGDENFRNQLTTNGFTSVIPQYYRSEGIQDPGNCTASPANNQIAYKAGDFCDISTNHPDWFLLDTNGNRMRTSPTSNYWRMDPGNAGWKSFFVTRLLEIDSQKGWSAVFLDNLEASLGEIRRDGLLPSRYPDDASYQAAVKGFIQYLYTNYSQAYSRPMVANIISRSTEAQWFNYIPYLTGAMQERWAVPWSNTAGYLSESKWSADMALAERTQAQGKYIVLVAQGAKTDTDRQKFAFASYLLVSNGKASFRYTDSSIYSEVWLYDNYQVQLGTPLAARYQSGTTWRRDFTNGYVSVDPVNHTVNISVNPPATATLTRTPTLTPTTLPTATPTRLPATATRTSTLAPTATSTRLSTATATMTRSSTSVPTATSTRLSTATATVTRSSTSVPTATNTKLSAATATGTRALTSAPTATNTSLPAATATTGSTTIMYNDKDPAFVYSSGWTEVAESNSYGGEFKLTQIVGSNVTFPFNGQKFSLIYKTGPLFGKMDVFVDGTKVYTLDQNTATAMFQQIWSYGGTLAAGAHQLKLVFLSGPTDGRVSIDAVSIP